MGEGNVLSVVLRGRLCPKKICQARPVDVGHAGVLACHRIRYLCCRDGSIFYLDLKKQEAPFTLDRFSIQTAVERTAVEFSFPLILHISTDFARCAIKKLLAARGSQEIYQ